MGINEATLSIPRNAIGGILYSIQNGCRVSDDHAWIFKVAVRGSWKENTGFQYCESKEQLLRNTRLLKEEVSELIAKKFLFEIVSRQNMCDRKHELYTLKFLCAPGNPLYTTSGLNVNFTVLYVKLIDLSYFK